MACAPVLTTKDHFFTAASGTLSKFEYAYDAEGNIARWTRQAGNAAAQTEDFAYDAADQLLSATLKEGAATKRHIAYGYDVAGNRIRENATVGQTPYANEYEALEFDAARRVTAVVKGSRRSEFFYDAWSRRVRTVERDATTVVSDKRYVWDGSEIVEERDAQTGGVTKRYFANGVEDAGTKLFFTRDHLGSVREVTDANGNATARSDYDPWGRQTQVGGVYQADFGYAGYWIHRPSGLNLTVFRAYDPSLGRWVSRDPIAEKGGLNIYGYVRNNPLRFVDVYGLSPDKNYPIDLGGGWRGRLDEIKSGPEGFEIHVVDHTGKECGIVNGRNGWIGKHGLSGVPPSGIPEGTLNRINGLNVDELRRRQIIPPKGFSNINPNRGGGYLFPGRRIYSFIPFLPLIPGILEDIDRYQRASDCGRTYDEQLREDFKDSGEYLDTPYGPIPNPYWQEIY
jgi:RHS repeat-associated protein